MVSKSFCFFRMRLYIQEKLRVKIMKAQIGVDLSKASLDACYLEDNETLRFKRKQVTNDKTGYRALLVWLKKVTQKAFTDIQVTLEATGVYHLNLAKFLRQKQIKVCVINPLRAKYYAKGLGMRAKTDRLDSIMLSRYGWERNPPEWQPASDQLLELKAMNLRLDAVEQDIRREKNRLESAELSAHSKEVVKLIKQSIKQLEKQASKLVELIDELVQSDEQLAKNRGLLETIDGIGQVTSRYLIAEIYEGRFTSASQCAAYMGLVPIPEQSGNEHKTKLSKAGNRTLKSKLYMAAISAKQYNPILKAHYDRLIARGKSKMSALCAVMRRLVQISYGVIKHQKAFCVQVD